MQPAWVGAVRALCDLLQDNQHQVDLLRQIDRDMRGLLDEKMALEDLVSRAVDHLILLTRASAGHFVLHLEKKDFITYTSKPEPGPSSEDLSKLFPLCGEGYQNSLKYLRKAQFGELPSMDSAETIVLAPVQLPTEGAIGMLVLESQIPHPLYQFEDEACRSLISAVADQLSNAFRFHEHWRKKELLTSA